VDGVDGVDGMDPVDRSVVARLILPRLNELSIHRDQLLAGWLEEGKIRGGLLADDPYIDDVRGDGWDFGSRERFIVRQNPQARTPSRGNGS
jgi:hypothetical protein